MKSLFLLVAVVAAGGCGHDSAGGQDMTSGAADLSASAAVDLSMTTNEDLGGLTGCHGLELCLAACKGSAGCQMTCRMAATMMAKKLAKTLNDCRQATCDAQDGGTGPCSAGTPPSAKCMLCLKDADSAPGTCSGNGMPSWCGACYQPFAACAADLP